MYYGGLSKEIVFQEVINQSDNNAGGEEGDESQPLGTLAGKGVMAKKHKGGQVYIKVNEPSYIIGIVSITPRIDYSQGNNWDVNLENMGQLHVSGFDQIGFQDLLTDQMAFWDTKVEWTGGVQNLTYKSAGKQPAWINYTTNVNYIKGNFAIQDDSAFMVLNRNYEAIYDSQDDITTIKDLTTYIDPKKYNNIFAETRRDAQNYWVQIGYNMTSRRKMSARQIPNL